MNILIVSNVLPSMGGVGTYINLLSDALRKKGHNVDVVSPLGNNRQFKAFSQSYILKTILFVCNNDFILYSLISFAKKMLLIKCRNILSNKRYDIIHAQDVGSYNALFPLCNSLQIPSILTIHGILSQEGVNDRGVRDGSWLKRKLMREEQTAFQLAAYVLTGTDSLRNYVLSLSNNRSQVKVIRNFVDTQLFYRKNLKKSDKFTILSAGRFVKRKGIMFLLEAILILKERINFRLVLAGYGPELDNYNNYINNNNITKYVYFAGKVDYKEMIELYNNADVLAIPSITGSGGEEGTTLTAMEAMACGVPIIASRTGGLAEIIDDLKNGILVPEQNAQALADAIYYMANNPDKREEMANVAFDQVYQQYSQDTASRAIMAIYSQAIDESKRRKGSLAV